MNQSMDSIRFQLSEPMSFIMVTYKNMVKGYLQEQ